MPQSKKNEEVMHRVRPGECFRSIAAAYGIADWNELFNHDKNASLKALRKDPHVLLPGDVVFVPKREKPSLTFSSGSPQRYKATIPKAPLKLALKDHEGHALSGKAYKLRVGKTTFEGTIPGDGNVEHQVPAIATYAELEIDMSGAIGGKVLLPIRIGHLDPVDSITGIQSRLNSLGIGCPVSGKLDEATRDALAVFQSKVGLDVTGEADAATRERLEHAHGNAAT